MKINGYIWTISKFTKSKTAESDFPEQEYHSILY